MPSWTFLAESSWLETNTKLSHLVLAGIELSLSGLIQQTTKKKKKKSLFTFFITKKTGFDIHAMETICMKCKSCFLGRMRNISKCCLLKILPRVLGVMVCTNKSRIGLCIAKPTIKLVRRDGSACTLSACTSVV